MEKKPFPRLKKELKNFITDETGAMSKENIIRGGIALGGVLVLSQSAFGHTYYEYRGHTNSVEIEGGFDSSGSGCAEAEHTNTVVEQLWC